MDISILSWCIPSLLGVSLLLLSSFFMVLWQRKALFGEFATGLLIVGGFFLVVCPFSVVIKLALILIQMWFIVLAVRLFFGRLESPFLQSSTKLNVGIGLASWACLVGVLWAIDGLGEQQFLQLTGNAISIVIAIFASVMLYQTIWTLKHYRVRKIHKEVHKYLPTVTLAIPARNETHALTECLTAAVASDYPKLEILVLDDCSQDETSALIRSFAHDGVRFIQGKQPSEGWLGKNLASSVLAREATGEYIIFTGVDTQLSPQSISKLVEYVLSHSIHMATVLPQRRDKVSIATLLWQLRYFWQIALPITNRRVPIATQAWIIKADILQQLGGFGAVSRKIMPETFFARKLMKDSAYRFLISDTNVGITTAKRWSSQNETALRFLYPTFKRQPFLILGGFIVIMLLLWQYVAIFALAAHPAFMVQWSLALLISVLLLISFALVVIRILPVFWLVTVLLFPLTLLQEAALLLISMMLYEFGEVNWKGRNVCYPVLNVSSKRHLS